MKTITESAFTVSLTSVSAKVTYRTVFGTYRPVRTDSESLIRVLSKLPLKFY